MEKIRDRKKRGKKSSSGETHDDVSTTSRDSNNSSNSNSNTSLPSIAATSTTTTTATMNIPTATLAANLHLPMSDKRALFQEKVRQSNEACQNADFQRAIRLYSEALDLDPANHILYSNRSAAHVKLKDYERALTDAIKARELNPKWPKMKINIKDKRQVQKQKQCLLSKALQVTTNKRKNMMSPVAMKYLYS